MTNENKYKFFLIFFSFIIGLTISSLITKIIKFDKKYNLKDRFLADATVVEVSYLYEFTYYEYEVDNNYYVGYYEGTNNYHDWDDIKILIDKDDYNDTILLSTFINEILFVSIFLVINIISLILYLCIYHNNKINNKLLNDKRRIQAKIDKIETSGVYLNKYVIVLSYEDIFTGEISYYKSKEFYFDPTNILKEKGIDYLDIYLDKNDKEKYYVDTRNIK